jgi:poly(3-hydroxybutyrate) depolymerase
MRDAVFVERVARGLIAEARVEALSVEPCIQHDALEALTGKYVVFDQSPFATGFGNGLSSEGVVYIPEACAKKDGCRLHIALHGCEQNREEVGKAFIEGSGFARWADANRFVILFPQVSANPLLNPKGCWDWWGYTGEDYLTKDASQIAAIWKMAERLAERPVRTESR